MQELKQFIDSVEQIAFEMPAPSSYTPRFVQLCIQGRALLQRLEAEEAKTGDADSELLAIHKVVMCIAEAEPPKDGDPYTLRAVKDMAQRLNEYRNKAPVGVTKEETIKKLNNLCGALLGTTTHDKTTSWWANTAYRLAMELQTSGLLDASPQPPNSDSPSPSGEIK